MSELNYDRCPNDDMKVGVAKVGENPKTGAAVELSINGIASVIAVQSAMLTLSASMKAGHEQDFLEKTALVLFEKLDSDPHAICPLLTICSMCLVLLQGQASVGFDDEGNVVISPSEDLQDGGPLCMYDLDEENDDESDETTLGKNE